MIDPGFLTSEFDVFALRTAIKKSQLFLTAQAWTGYVLGPVGQLANATTDDELDDYIRNSASTTCHPVGSAGMSAKDARYGVVDPDLRVKGILGLRIIGKFMQFPSLITAEQSMPQMRPSWYVFISLNLGNQV